jgi:ferritin-like metal-binding protein YciE
LLSVRARAHESGQKVVKYQSDAVELLSETLEEEEEEATDEALTELAETVINAEAEGEEVEAG